MGAHGFKRPQTVVANNAINLKVIEESAAEWLIKEMHQERKSCIY